MNNTTSKQRIDRPTKVVFAMVALAMFYTLGLNQGEYNLIKNTIAEKCSTKPSYQYDKCRATVTINLSS